MLSHRARPRALRGAAIALFCAVLCAAPPTRADELQDASRLLKAGRPEEALKKVNQVLAERGDDLQARFLKGLILAEQGNTREAIEIFARLTRDHPDLPEPYNNLAVIYASVGQYNEARAALEQSIRTRPNYATAYENLGDVYAKLASQAYDKVVQLDASNSGARNKLSLARELVSRPATVAPSRQLPEAQAVAATESSRPPAAAEATISPSPPAAKPEAKDVSRPPAAAEATISPSPPEPKPEAKDVSRPPAAAEAAISPSPPATKPEAKDVSAEVLDTVIGWAEAWSRQDADAYLAYYAKDFKTPSGEPRAEWERVRRSLVRAPASIAVGIESPRVTLAGARRASISFVQTYRSDKLSSTIRKTLLMTLADGRWQISEEKTPPPVTGPATVAPSRQLPEAQAVAATESSPPSVVAVPDVSRPPAAAEAAIPPSPPATKPEAKDVSAEVLDTVIGWAEAWSRQDADAYLAYYAKDFKTPGGEPRAEWERVRRSLVRAPSSIAVGIESPRVTMAGARRASISFVQTYRSDKLSSTIRKTLLMTLADGRWQISEEKTPP